MNKIIRPVDPADAPALAAIYAPFVNDGAVSFETEVPDAAEMQRRVHAQRERYPWLVFEEDGEVRAYAYASEHRARRAYRWCVEVSAYAHERARRRGIGRALYACLLELLRRQGYANAYAGVTLPNAASLALHRTAGFNMVGVYAKIGFKQGRWHDVAWLELRLCDDAAPAEPIAMKQLYAQNDFTALFERHAAGTQGV